MSSIRGMASLLSIGRLHSPFMLSGVQRIGSCYCACSWRHDGGRRLMASSPAPQFTDAAWGRFDAAARKIFENWTLLRMAVDLGWGGRDSRQKADALVEEVLLMFLAAAQGRARRRDGDFLGEWLQEALETRFSAVADDDSDEEVGAMLVDLFERCERGDFSLADHVMSTPKNEFPTNVPAVGAGAGATLESDGEDEETDSDGEDEGM